MRSIIMKFGVRKPSIKRSITARTTGKLKRTVKKTVNPLYGKKGMGYINDPKKAVYNKVYNKTTIGVRDIVDVKTKSGHRAYNSEIDPYQDYTSTVYMGPNIDLNKYKSSSKTYKATGAFLIIISFFLGFSGLFIMPIGLLFIGLGVLFFAVGRTYRKVAKLKKYNETELPLLSEPYIDDDSEIWEVAYKYDYIDIKLVNGTIDDFKVNQIVDFEINDNIDDVSSVRIMANKVFIGYINTLGQCQMIIDYAKKNGHMVQAQFSFLSKENVFIRIIYYRSKKHREQEEAEAKAKYEAEKATYIRKPPISFDTALVYNKNSEMQDDIQCVDVGETIVFDQEDDGKYLAIAKDVLYLGYLPKKIADRIDELQNEGYEIIDSKIIKKEYDDAYRYIVTVSISLEDTNYL